MKEEYNATVVKSDCFSEGLFLLTVKPDEPIKTFKPGQFTTLGLKMPNKDSGTTKLVKKAYSIASSPVQNHFLEFYIVVVPHGDLTPYLFELKHGDRLFVGPRITGNFTLEKVPQDKNLLMVATGTGIAPFVSMIRTHLICGDPGKRKFVLIHGVRHSRDITYYAEFDSLDMHCPNFFFIPAVSRPQTDLYWGGPKGRVTQIIPEGIVEKRCGIALKPENFEILMCGNPDMIKDMTEYFMKENGFSKEQIHAEKYW